MGKLISVIIPIYNEAENIDYLIERLRKVFQDRKYEFIFVNDGSYDKSLQILKEYSKQDDKIKLLSFARNFGHQIAVTAGIDHCTGDAAIIIDADLQDPPELIPELISKWEEGYEVVYAQRQKRKGESIFKKITASAFYRILRKLTRINIPVDTGDFRLIDRKIIEVLKNMPEKNRFIRGMVAWSGFNQTGIEYVRDKRHKGETKYTLSKMLKLALAGLTSFSKTPLYWSIYWGALIFLSGIIVFIWNLIHSIVNQVSFTGNIINTILILLIGGIILIAIGIVGEYIANIADGVKNRPVYILAEKINFND